ncbi:hypothetical protein COCON_G00234940 [Conger conger]|uniref:Uncharacterized protein n=1 Tax=Conger conger TaxID=82655 RepID=A0A9Q1CUR1_CONCO|nr:hypothetical protein COCON_G00234940 [Conger conger]
MEGWVWAHHRTLSWVYCKVLESVWHQQQRDQTRYDRWLKTLPLLPGNQLQPEWPVYVVQPEGHQEERINGTTCAPFRWAMPGGSPQKRRKQNGNQNQDRGPPPACVALFP